MTATASEERTRTFHPNLPAHHLDLADINRLAEVFGTSGRATPEDRALMSTEGDGREAIQQRFAGVTAHLRSLLGRRTALLGCTQWDVVVTQIKSGRFVRSIQELPVLPDADYFLTLSEAMGVAEALRRSVILEGLTDRWQALVASDGWDPELVRASHYQKVLTEGVRDRGSEHYVALVTRALEVGERALRSTQSGERRTTQAAPAKRSHSRASARHSRRQPPVTPDPAPAGKPGKDHSKRR